MPAGTQPGTEICTLAFLGARQHLLEQQQLVVACLSGVLLIIMLWVSLIQVHQQGSERHSPSCAADSMPLLQLKVHTTKPVGPLGGAAPPKQPMYGVVSVATVLALLELERLLALRRRQRTSKPLLEGQPLMPIKRHDSTTRHSPGGHGLQTCCSRKLRAAAEGSAWCRCRRCQQRSHTSCAAGSVERPPSPPGRTTTAQAAVRLPLSLHSHCPAKPPL